MLILLINCRSCAEWIIPCLQSVQEQSVWNWQAFITVEPSTDDMARRAEEFTRTDSRFSVKVNNRRKYSLANQVSAISRSGSDPEDVIISLDGDDRFITKDALKIIADAYSDPNVWMTYGSWVSPGKFGEKAGMWPAYPEETTDFRNSRWLGTAVRTWKRWLWDRLPDKQLRDADGNYFRIAEDRVIMIPLLEMCGTEHARHIGEPLMEYNQVSNYDECAVRESEEAVAWLKAGKPLQRQER